MKPAALLFTLLFVTMIALSLAANLKKKKLTTESTTDAKTTQTSIIQPFHGGVVEVNSALPTISLGNSAGAFGTGSFTLTFWFQTNGSSSYADIIGNRQQGGYGNYLSLRLTVAGAISAELCQDSSGTNYVALNSAVSGLNDGNGHHLSLVRSGSQVSLYIDGALTSQASASPASITGQYPFQLGLSYSGFSPYTINFSDLRIYNSALTVTQLKVLTFGVPFEYE